MKDRLKIERIKVEEYSSLKGASESVRRDEAYSFVGLPWWLIENTRLHTRVPCGEKLRALQET